MTLISFVTVDGKDSLPLLIYLQTDYATPCESLVQYHPPWKNLQRFLSLKHPYKLPAQGNFGTVSLMSYI